MSERWKLLSWRVGCLVAVAVIAWLLRDFRWDVVWKNRWFLLSGLGRSWLLAVAAMILGLMGGILLAAARRSGPAGLRHAAAGFIEVVRATPQLMVIFWVYFAYPKLAGHNLEAWTAATVSLAMIAAAFIAEIVRAGLASVPKAQLESGFATGLSPAQIFREILLPQALRNMVPALLAQTVMMFKTTSLVYVVGLIDFFRAVVLVNNREFAPYELYLTLAAGYFLCCYALSAMVRRLDPKYVLAT
jgi:His/Glu/Gln/Arg/opine family amino acid ABC transporter permease subunit